MSLVGFKAQNHEQQVLVHGPRSHVDDRGTTPEVFDPLHERFRFSIDVAAAAHNAKLERFYTAEQDGLAQSWEGERVWCNPPYSNLAPWLEKAWRSRAELVVMLLPANRTEQRWWQQYVEPYRDKPQGVRCEFLQGRLRFLKPGQKYIGPNERPPFGCCLLVWDPPIEPVAEARDAARASRPGSATKRQRPEEGQMKIWDCKIGEVDESNLPGGSDAPMRRAVERAYQEITGEESAFCFSGWGGRLTEGERAVVEDRLPAPPTVADIATLLVDVLTPQAVVAWLEERVEKWAAEAGPYDLYSEALALAEGVFQ